MIAADSTSYPLLAISQNMNVDYGDVLAYHDLVSGRFQMSPLHHDAAIQRLYQHPNSVNVRAKIISAIGWDKVSRR